MRRFRPPLPARIEIRERHPVLIRSAIFNGVIADIRGPFFSSGNWWENNRWWREEWDIQTADGNLYRIFRAAKEVEETVGRVSCSVREDPFPMRTALAPLSLTPRFSGVYECPEVSINCFNSFSIDSEHRQRSGMSNAPSSQSDIVALAASIPSGRCVPPLPKGEGWGEGEGIVCQPTVHEAAQHTQQPAVHGEGKERVSLHRHGFEFFVEGIYD